MTDQKPILCIGSVLWDIIGRADRPMQVGTDIGGRITRIPGGVAMNIAMTLVRFGLAPSILTAVGQDDEGEELMAACRRMGIATDHVYRSEDLPTDRYMAIEGANGLIAAIADAHSLEAADDKILRALYDGTLGSVDAPYAGQIALDGNLTSPLLSKIATSDAFSKADLRIAPASPGKAERLLPLLPVKNATLYVNLEEAGILCQSEFATSAAAADGLLSRGAQRVMVSDGGDPATLATPDNSISMAPPPVLVTRVTGAGDTFMAAHIAAESRGETNEIALQTALRAAATYVSGDTPV